MKVRKQLGSLKGLTVQPRTRERYQACLDKFVDWLGGEGLSLPKRAQAMDSVVSGYLEFLWAAGESKSVANNTLAALQDKEPGLKRRLTGSWRLLKAWLTAEIPNRAPPMTLTVLDALCGWFVMKEKPSRLLWAVANGGVAQPPCSGCFSAFPQRARRAFFSAYESWCTTRSS